MSLAFAVLLFFVFVRGSTRVLIRDWFIDLLCVSDARMNRIESIVTNKVQCTVLLVLKYVLEYTMTLELLPNLQVIPNIERDDHDVMSCQLADVFSFVMKK